MAKNEDIQVERFYSIQDVKKDLWNSIVLKGDVINSYEFLEAEEKSGINNFQYRYCMFFKKEQLIAHASVGVLTFGLDVMADKSLKNIFESVKKIFPSFLKITLVECGHPTAIGNALTLAQGADAGCILGLLDTQFRVIAREEKTHLIALRDVYTKDFTRFHGLRMLGFRPIPNLANTFIKLGHKNFDDYLSDLTAKRRHEIRRRQKAFNDSGCTIVLIEDFAHLAPVLAGLWTNTYEHAKEYQREILNEKYFTLMSDCLGKKSFIFLCLKNEKPIGFTMFLDAGESLVSTYCGLDYRKNRSTYTYFILFYKSIEEAILRGKKWLELGVTNYNPKIEIGAIPDPMFIYARSLRPVFNLFLGPLLKLMNTSPEFNKRKIFNSRYFLRFPLPPDSPVYDGKNRLRILDVSFHGLSVEGRKPLAGRINMEIPGDFPIMLTVRVRHTSAESSGGYRMGCVIIKARKEHLYQWRLFVTRFGNGG